MNLHEYIDKYKGTPDVLTELLRYRYHSEDIAVYSPDDVSPEYSRFCEALALPKPPYVLVMPDDFVSTKHKDTYGYYVRETNLVGIAASVFKEFQKGDPFSEYVVGHELGHAKSHATRRDFMSKSLVYGGAGAAFLGSYTVTGAMSSLINGPIDEQEHPFLAFTEKAVKTVGASMVASVTMQQLKAYLVADEEFRADDFAAQVMSRPEILDGMETHLERRMQKSSPELLAQMKEEFPIMLAQAEEKNGKPLAPERVRLAWVRALANESPRPPVYSLGAILKPDYYPRMSERFARIQRQEMANKTENSR